MEEFDNHFVDYKIYILDGIFKLSALKAASEDLVVDKRGTG